MADNEENTEERGRTQEQSGGGREDSDDSSRADDDPRNIGDQSEEHNAEARDAQVELSPEEREEQITSAAPHDGDIEETPEWPGAEDHAEGEGEGESEGEREESSSRVSVVDEKEPRPEPPDGSSDEEYKWHTYKVYPSGQPHAV